MRDVAMAGAARIPISVFGGSLKNLLTRLLGTAAVKKRSNEEESNRKMQMMLFWTAYCRDDRDT